MEKSWVMMVPLRPWSLASTQTADFGATSSYGPVCLVAKVSPLGGAKPLITMSMLLVRSQFVQRVLVMFMPAKYQPDYMFLRNVPMRRVHLFTIIQLVCIVVLCVIKELGIISIIFPVMVSTTYRSLQIPQHDID